MLICRLPAMDLAVMVLRLLLLRYWESAHCFIGIAKLKKSIVARIQRLVVW